jgi:hypothetical protein
MHMPDSDRELPDGPALLLGWMVPLFLVLFGLTSMITRHGFIPSRYGDLLVEGRNAVALGLACIGGAFALHCSYVWERTKSLAGVASVGQAAGLLVFITSAGVLIWKVGILGTL